MLPITNMMPVLEYLAICLGVEGTPYPLRTDLGRGRRRKLNKYSVTRVMKKRNIRDSEV